VKRTSKPTSGSPRRSPARRKARQRKAPPPRTKHGAPRESLNALLAFAEAAEQQAVRWYLFGAQAVAAYGVPRTTGDVDVTIDVGERGLTSFIAPLRRAGFVPRIADESFAIETRVFPVTHRATGWNFDLVLAGPGLEQRFLDDVRLFQVGRHQIPVIAPEDLVTLKILAGRPKDLEDVRGLLRIAQLDHARIESTLGVSPRRRPDPRRTSRRSRSRSARG
jgi:hypothetical protein